MKPVTTVLIAALIVLAIATGIGCAQALAADPFVPQFHTLKLAGKFGDEPEHEPTPPPEGFVYVLAWIINDVGEDETLIAASKNTPLTADDRAALDAWSAAIPEDGPWIAGTTILGLSILMDQAIEAGAIPESAPQPLFVWDGYVWGGGGILVGPGIELPSGQRWRTCTMFRREDPNEVP